jgi:D-arabinose 1-dehydrogenase-like Zn-dependent alcohol dehydrogenase
MRQALRSRAVVLRTFGNALAMEEFDVPPAEEGATVVGIDYGGVCGTDLHLQLGHLDVPTPLVLGHEGLGTVHELGAGVDRWSSRLPTTSIRRPLCPSPVRGRP